MMLNTKSIVTITEANQNFSKIARIVDKEKSIIVMKNNRPKYVIIEFDEFKKSMENESDNLDDIADRVLSSNLEAFIELAR